MMLRMTSPEHGCNKVCKIRDLVDRLYIQGVQQRRRIVEEYQV